MRQDEAPSPGTDEQGAQDYAEGPDAQQQEGSEGRNAMAWLQWAANPANAIAEHLDSSKLAEIGSKVVEAYKIDLASREGEGYDEKIETALKLATLAKEAKNYPWPNAANVKFPLIIQAAIQFNARTYSALIDGPNVAKGVVLGGDQGVPQTDQSGQPVQGPDGQPAWRIAPGAKKARADRIGRHMSYQLLQEMAEWEDDTDALLLRLPIVGTLFRKTYFDPVKGRPASDIIGPDKFVVNYHAKRDLAVVPRGTHVLEFYPHEIKTKMRSGLWLEKDLGQPTNADNDDQAPHTFLEQFCLWDLDGDDYPEPYFVTVHEETQQVVRIAARFDADGIKADQSGKVIEVVPTKTYTKYSFIPNPDGGFYDIGFGTLLGPLAETINTSINQLMDAGHLSNVQGGFIGSGVSIKSGSLRFQPGEWKKADAGGQNLSQSIVPLPTKEPSAVLYNLMEFLIGTAKELTATQDILSGDSSKATMPVGTVMALIEQGLKTFTSILKRVFRALKDELSVLYDLNARYLNPQAYFTFQDQPGVIAQQDYKEGDVDVVAVADPRMATDMQKMGRVQFMLSLRGAGLDDMEINKFALEASGIPDPQRFMPKGPPPPNPKLLVDTAKINVAAHKAETDAALAASQIAVNEANAQATMMQAFMASPQAQQMIAAFIDARVQEVLHGGNAEVQPQGVPGMAPGAGQPPVLPVPQGPAGGPGPALGGGGGNGLPPAMQGPADGGVGGPGV